MINNVDCFRSTIERHYLKLKQANMKSTKVILLASLVLAGTSAFAQRRNDDSNRQNRDNRRTEVRSDRKRADEPTEKVKAKTEDRSDRKQSDDRESNTRSESRSTDRTLVVRNQDDRSDERRPDAKKEDDRGGRKIVVAENGRIRYSESNNHSDSKDKDRGYDRDRDRGDNRYSDRNDRFDNRRDNRYETRHDGRYDKRSMIFANNRPYRHQETCFLCYGPRLRGGFSYSYSTSELAWMETDRLAMVIDLSDRQLERIYKINLNYLTHRYNNRYSGMERRERDIRRVLSWSQERDYELYLRDLDATEFCEHCHDGFGDNHFRIAFRINL